MKSFLGGILAIVIAGCGATPLGGSDSLLQADAGVAATSGKSDPFQVAAGINDAPWIRHREYSEGVMRLIRLGDAAYEPALELLLVDDETTRLRAETVLQNLISGRFGFVVGKGWPNRDAEKQSAELWKELGSMDSGAPLDQRVKSYLLWRQWIRRGKHASTRDSVPRVESR